MHRPLLRLGGAVVAATALFTACGGGSDGQATADDATAEDATTTVEDGWSYTDGSGKEVRLDQRPTRIIAHASAASALMSFGIEPIAIYADVPVEDDLALDGLDLEGIEIVGEEWGVINVEAVAALDPDLIVSEWWPVEEGYTGMEPGAGTTLENMEAIAPVVGIAQGSSIVAMIEDYAELAESLGVPADDPEVVADREAFDEAVATFEEAVEAKPGLSVLAVSPSEEGLYVAVPEYAAELSDFQQWGMQLVVPDSPDEGFEYWETLSWENADKYQADLILVDERSYPDNLDLARAQPTWPALAAGEAEATAVWPAYWVRSYDAYAESLAALTEAVDGADEDLVS